MAAEALPAAAAVGGATMAGLFSYNRENYMYDAEFRYERFTSGREYGCQQTEQYRNDIRAMAGFFCKKNALWCTTASLTMALCVALYCAGRLGLHGPSPSAWLINLWYTNNAAAFGFMALCIWLSMHAGFRANAAGVHLLTRKVRLPVPTLKQLDRARKFGSEFEQQNWSDIFRVPYVSNNGAPKTDSADYEPAEGKKGGRSRSAPPGRRSRPSSWVAQEFREDYNTSSGTITGPSPDGVPPLPEHFQQFAEVQDQFYQYDVYARVCLFCGFICFVNGLCYYGLGQINIELRAFWVAYATIFVIAVTMALILRFDIIPSDMSSKKYYLPHCEWLGPLATLPAAIAMSLDFQVQFDMTAVAFCWILIFITYVMQTLFHLRILELIVPDFKLADRADDVVGACWYPRNWVVPSAFHHVCYQVTPPTRLQKGQTDIVREIKEGYTGAKMEVVHGASPAASSSSSAKEKEAGNSSDEEGAKERTRVYHNPNPAWAQTKHVQPWKLVVGIQLVLCSTWPFLILGTIVDVAIGEQALITAPHWSRPPMTRLSLKPHELGTPLGFPWAAGDEPYLPEQMAWHEEKRHAHHHVMGGDPADPHNQHRRLQQVPEGPVGFSHALEGLLQTVQQAEQGPKVAPEPVSWPSFFEPQLLACGPQSQIAAFTPRGFGSSVTLGGPRGQPAQTVNLQLSGLMHLPPLVGAHWGHDGLLVVTRHGDLAHCPAPRTAIGGQWACGPAAGAPAQLPVTKGARLAAAAAAMIGGKLHAAIVDEAMPELVALFAHEADTWLPLGEMPVPRGQSGRGTRTSLSFVGDGDLVVATDAGSVLRRRLSDGAIVASATHPVDHKATWQGACGLQHSEGTGIAHLRLRQASHAVHPEVVALELVHGAKHGKPIFFQ